MLSIAMIQFPYSTPEAFSFGGIVSVGAILALVLVFSIIFLFVSRYKRCPANQILVISGRVGDGKSAKVIAGGGSFVWPVIQEAQYLSLEPMQIDIKLSDALSAENIRVAVPSVFTIAVGADEETRQNAAQRLLGLAPAQIMKQAEDIIFGQLRQVIASMKIEEINKDRESFLTKVMHNLEPELKKIGLILLNVNIKDLNDASGYIEAIGRKAAAEAVQKARGDVAEQEKLGEIRVADADRDQAVAVANAQKEREIGLREAQREQAVKVAELEKEQKIGEETARFQQEAQIADAEQRKRIAVADANATAIRGEAEAKAKIADAEAQLKVKEAEAFQIGETKKRQAAAAVEEAEAKARAQAALAEAERIENDRRAQLEAPAKAEKAKKIVEAEAEKESRILAAQAEAATIFAKAEAEARGEYEKLSKRAQGLREYVEAAGGPEYAYRIMMIDYLPQLADIVAKSISEVDFGKVVVWDGGNGSGSGRGGAAGFLKEIATMVPGMLQVVEEVGGTKLPSFLGERIKEEAKVAVPGIFSPSEDADAPKSEEGGEAEKK